ncbi:transposase [bacterium]|nr:transposase [bacterium]|tara:strand:- start:421 stop:720 length:300 start_codon:yes stop_codon:yes gene_type:complete
MKKLILFLYTFFTANFVYATYLDDWTNDELCGWTNSASIPEHIQNEVEKREILCYGGIEVSSLPAEADLSSEYGTVFESPDPTLIIGEISKSMEDKYYK